MTASSFDELSAALRDVAGDQIPYQPAVGHDDRGPVWVFSGQGSQWPGMGTELLVAEPVFAATVAAMEPVIARESGFSVTEAMSAPQTVSGIDRVQPTIFAVQVALAAALKSYGVRPGAIIGHSLGEAAAAVVAGALSLHDGLRVICRRSRLMSRIAGSGAMASVELPGQQVLSELAIRGISDVVLSVVASPTSTVVGGATQSIRDLVAAWEQQDVLAREVAVDVASHTPQVDPILDELLEVLAEVDPTAPEIPYYSATLWIRASDRRSPASTGWKTCGTRCDSRRRYRPRSRTGTECSASWLRIRCSPTRSSRTPPVSTCRSQRLPRCGAGNSCRSGCAASSRRAQRRRQGGLLCPVP